VSDLIEKNIEHLLVKQNEKHLVLAVHPYLHAYFTQGFISQRMRWYFKYMRWVRLVKDTSMAIMEYKFLNKEGEEIQVT
jgi:ribonuclease G